MRSAEAVDILRTLTEGGLEANLPLGDLSETIRSNWPGDFAHTLPAPPKLIGQRPITSAREIHLRGLQETICNRSTLGCDLATTKLSYHARWLLYLGAPEHEASPKVSIVVPIYNRAWLVESVIENCLAQRYSPIEIVVVDDGSTDNTSARLGRFADRIKLIKQPNGGVSAARNAGVLAATGELVQFLDSDNLLDGDHIEKKVRAFASIPDADLCYCKPTDVSLFGVRSPLHLNQAYRVSDGDVLPTIDLLDSIMADGYPFLTSAVTMPRHVFHQHGGFETDLRRAEDARYWFHLALAGVKAIGLDDRLFYRCRLIDGLNERRSENDTMSSLVCMRNVLDLLRRPDRWPLVAEYVAGHGGKRWRELLGTEASTYGRDFELLLETVADLPPAGRDDNRSPLPLLLFLWMVSARVGAKIGLTPSSGNERLVRALVSAIDRSAPLGRLDQNDWLSRAEKLRAKRMFAKIVSVATRPAVSIESRPKVGEAAAFLRAIADAMREGEGGAVAGRRSKKKGARATVVVPVLADPRTAEPTVASCLRQGIADRIEIILVERDARRAASWSDRYPQVRVIKSPMADRVVEAHAAGLRAASYKRIRFLLPGDILGSDSVGRQIEASQEFDDSVAVVEINGRRPHEPTLSAILFPVPILAQVGGFDLALGNEYAYRYLFRLTAADVSREFIEGRSSLRARETLQGSADQIVIAALANLSQCLGDSRLWYLIPAVASRLTSMTISTVGDAQLHFLKIRTLDFTLEKINALSTSAASGSPLVPFALCLIGLEWEASSARQSAPQLELLRSAILKGITDTPFDTAVESSIRHVLAEAPDATAFAKAAARVLVSLDGCPQYAGLRTLLQHVQSLLPRRSRWWSPATRCL